MNDLIGQHANHTGGGSGIGLACARTFLRDGASVTLLGRTQSTLEQAITTLNDDLPARSGEVRCSVADITDEQALADAIANGPPAPTHNACGCQCRHRRGQSIFYKPHLSNGISGHPNQLKWHVLYPQTCRSGDRGERWWCTLRHFFNCRITHTQIHECLLHQ